MSTSFLFQLWLVCFIVYIAIDSLWVGLLMSTFYKKSLKHLLRLDKNDHMHPAWLPALLVYLVLPLGIVFFVYPAVFQSDTLLPVFLRGFLFGSLVYGIYECTNWATLKKWPAKVVAVDTLWGGFLCGILSCILVLVDGRLS